MYNIPPTELKYLGRKIQTRRKALGLTQEQLAEKLNCSLTHLCRIEGGCKPGMDALLRICRVLGCSLDELLGLYPPDNQIIQQIISRVQTRPEREQRIALLILDHLFTLLDRLHDPDDSLLFSLPPSQPGDNLTKESPPEDKLPANPSFSFQESSSSKSVLAETSLPDSSL